MTASVSILMMISCNYTIHRKKLFASNSPNTIKLQQRKNRERKNKHQLKSPVLVFISSSSSFCVLASTPRRTTLFLIVLYFLAYTTLARCARNRFSTQCFSTLCSSFLGVLFGFVSVFRHFNISFAKTRHNMNELGKIYFFALCRSRRLSGKRFPLRLCFLVAFFSSSTKNTAVYFSNSLNCLDKEIADLDNDLNCMFFFHI